MTDLKSFYVEVNRLPARVVTLEGQSFETEIFLHVLSDQGPRRESLGDRLNREHMFLPCELEGRVELINLEWVAYLECRAELPELAEQEELGAQTRQAELLLSTGEIMSGELVYIEPASRRRVSDLLNDSKQRFFLMKSPRGNFYIHRRAILRVRL